MEILSHLAPLTALRELTLKYASAADLSIEDLEQLQGLPALRHLHFGRTLPKGTARRRRLKVRGGWEWRLAGWLVGGADRWHELRERASVACSDACIVASLGW